MLKVSFYLRKQSFVKGFPENKIYLLVYDGKQSASLTTGYSVNPKFWDKKRKRVKIDGKSKVVNEYLDNLESKVRKIERFYLEKSLPYTPQNIIDDLKHAPRLQEPKKRKEKSITEILAEFIENKWNKQEIKLPNYKGYKAKLQKIKAFFEQENMPNLTYAEFNYSIYEKLFSFCKNHKVKGNKVIQTENLQNSYLKRVLALIRQGHSYAQKKGYTKSALFDFDKIRDDTKPTAFLTEKELEKLENLHLEDKETAFIRDVFIFCAYTGFLHSDLKDFEPKKHLLQDQDGDLWIIKPRSKTNETIKQLIHPKAKAILEKYDYCIKPEYEVKHNRTLKFLAKVCGINKEISIRVARRTFAILCRNTFGFPDEITYQLMGHKDTRNLQKHYALTTDENIKKHLKGFYTRIEQQEKEKQEKQNTTSNNDNLILNEIKQIREHLQVLHKKNPHSGI